MTHGPDIRDVDGYPLQVGQQVVITDFRKHREHMAYLDWNASMVELIDKKAIIIDIDSNINPDSGEPRATLDIDDNWIWRGCWLRGVRPRGLKHLAQRYKTGDLCH